MVEQLLAAAQGDLHLDLALLEVHAHGHHGQAFLFHAGRHLADLGGVQQQAARAVGILGHIAGIVVRGDMQRKHEGLAVTEIHIAVQKVDLSGPDAFDFRAGQADARFHEVGEFVQVAGLLVDGDGGRGWFFAHIPNCSS